MSETKILIVEDEFVVANDIEARLLDLRYGVAGKASSGEEAIQLAESVSPRLVLMDIHLRGEMDGITTAMEIRRRFKIPVVFLTAYADDDTLERAKEAEPFGYILKPFEDRELRTIIEIAVYKHRAEAEIRRLSRLYATLSQVNQAIVRARTREELFPKICEIALEFGHFKTAWIGMAGDGAGELTAISKAGEDAGVTVGESARHCCCAAPAIQQKRPCVINELRDDPRTTGCKELQEKHGVRSCGAFPIRFQNEVCGVFVVGAKEPGFFNEAEMRLLDEVVLDISYALDHFEMERKREEAEDSAKERQQHLETILSTALDGFWVVDAHGKFLEVNDAYCVMSGYTREELLKMQIQDVEVDETREETAGRIKRIVGSGRERFETRHRRKDGGVIDLEIQVTYQLFDGGRMICFLRDITGRKRAEEELRFKNALLLTQQEASIDGILVVDEKARILSYNRRFVEMWGVPESLVDSEQDAPVLQFVTSQVLDRRAFLRQVQYLYEHRTESGSDEIVLADGRTFDRYSAPMFGAEGTFYGRVWYFRDISAYKRAELELIESRNSLQIAVDAAKLGVWSHDLLTREVFWDERTRAIYGVTPEAELTLDLLFSLIAPEDREAAVRTTREQDPTNNANQSLEFRIFRQDGTSGWIHARGTTMCNSSGQPVRQTGVLMDITEKKLAEQEMRGLEEQLRHAQKMEAVGRLAGGVAHDFNNLLMVIRSYAEMLQDSLAADDSSRKKTQQILQAAERAASLTAQLLAFSRKQIISSRIIDLNKTISETTNMLRRMVGEDVDFQIIGGESLWPIKADSDQIVQILMNLCVNSRDAMPRGGTLTIATRNVTIGKESQENQDTQNLPPGEYVTLSVTDTGVGISGETQQRMFEPFFTTKEIGRGTGLGLSTVYGIVEQSGGHIRIRSGVGEGACFTIYLPKSEEMATAAAEAEGEGYEVGTETLLVVEDEDALRESISEFLRALGYTVLEAESGQQALSVVAEFTGVIHLLLTDVVMPRMSGRELSEMLLTIRPGLKMIYMSGYTDDAVVRYGARDAGVMFLQKPFSMATLARKVREALTARLHGTTEASAGR